MKPIPTFDAVVDAHGATVLRVCASFLGPGAGAEDAWSETFLAALRAYPFDESVNVEAWLVRVAQHKSIDVLRYRRRESPVDGAQDVLQPDSVAPPPHLDDELWADVSALTHRQRFVVAHRFIAQWTYPEIAEKLGCSPAAARRIGSDAIASLRRRRTAREEQLT